MLQEQQNKQKQTKNRQVWKPLFISDDYNESFETKTLSDMKFDDAQLYSFGVKISEKRRRILSSIDKEHGEEMH